MLKDGRPLKVACNIQPVLDPEMTGIGTATFEIVSRMLNFDDLDICLEAFAETAEKQRRAYERFPLLDDGSISLFTRMRSAVYQAIWAFFPLSYSLFFKTKADARVFFNYHVPPGASGKKIVCIYDMVIKRFPETMNLKTRLMLALTLKASCGRADHIITISQFSKREIMECMGIEAERITVIPMGADSSVFHANYSVTVVDDALARYGLKRPYFFYLGTLEPRKNIAMLVRSYAELCKRFDAPQLVLAGRKGWQYNEIMTAIKEEDIEEKVLFLGYVQRSDIPLLMCGARAFLFPSLYEGFGMPPLEAMSCGCPVMASNAASLPEVVGEAGVLVDPMDMGGISDALYRLATDDGLCKTLSEKGIEQAKMFSWETAAERIRKIIYGQADIV